MTATSRYRSSEKFRATHRRWQDAQIADDGEKRIRYMLRNAKSRAKRQHVAFNLSPCNLTIPKVCPVLGTPLKFGCGRGDPASPALDRTIPSRGYVKGNVRVISQKANNLKRDCTDPNVFRKIADYLEGAV